MAQPNANSPRIGGWSTRVAVLVALAAVLGIGFAASYEGGLHSPRVRNIRVGLVAPPSIVDQVQATVGAKSNAVRIVPVPSEGDARAQLADRVLAGAVVLDQQPVGSGQAPIDTLLVTQVPSQVIGQTVQDTVGSFEAQLNRGYRVETVNPFTAGDPLGLGVFYLAIALVVAGYLLAALLAFTQPELSTVTAWLRRLGAYAAYAIAVGVGGALIVGPWLGILDRHVAVIAGVASLLVFAVVTVGTLADVAFGPVYGTGVAIVLFVIIGNPAAGGPFPRSMAPAFFRDIGGGLPTGFGTDAFRAVTYLGGDGLWGAIIKMAAYAVVGTAGTAGLIWWRHRSRSAVESERRSEAT